MPIILTSHISSKTPIGKYNEFEKQTTNKPKTILELFVVCFSNSLYSLTQRGIHLICCTLPQIDAKYITY
jgi:hypothetical protein